MRDQHRPGATVVGGCGFIGNRLVQTLIAAGFDVHVVDTAPLPAGLASRCRLTSCDVVRTGSLRDAVADAGVVFLLAARLARECRTDPVGSWAVNVDGTSRLLRAILEAGRRPRVVFLSSGYVYATPAARYPVDEEAALGPLDLYGLTKVAGENMVAAAAFAGSFPAAVLRPFTVYGDGRSSARRGHFIASWIDHAERGLRLPIDGDGRQTVDLTHVEDVVRACRAVLDAPIEAGECRVFNVGSGRETEVREVARWFTDVWPWVTAERRTSSDVVRYRQVGDIRRAQTELGYLPSADAEHEIKSLLRSHPAAHAAGRSPALESERPV